MSRTIPKISTFLGQSMLLMPLVSLCLFYPFKGNTQPNTHQFKKLGVESGLSHASVTSIIQDTAGYLWLATQFGLNRFDGEKFYVFNPNNQKKPGLQSWQIQKVYQDSKGQIWVGTHFKGLHRYLPEEETFRHYSIPHEGEWIMDASVIMEDSYQTLYVGTKRRGLFYVDPVQDSLISLSDSSDIPERLSKTQIFTLFEDTDQRLWVGTKQEGIFILNQDRKTWEEIPLLSPEPQLEGNQNIRSFFQDKSGNMWVGTERGIFIQKLGEKEFHHLEVPDVTSPVIGDVYIRCIYEDRQENLWIGTEGGLFLFDRTDSSFTTFLFDPNDGGSISNNTITTILEDQSGVLWIGTDNGGLNFLEERQNPFRYYGIHDYAIDSPISLHMVRSLLQTTKGEFLVGTSVSGVRLCDSNYHNCSIISAKNPQSTNSGEDKIYDLIEDNEGRIFVGAIKRRLFRFQPKEKNLRPYTFSPCRIAASPKDNNLGINYLDFYKDPKGKIWVCLLTEGEDLQSDPLTGGILTYNPELDSFICWTEVVPYADRLPLQNVYTLAIQDSLYWIGTPNGLYGLNTSNGDIQHFQENPFDPNKLANPHVRRLHLDQDGVLWIGSLQYLNSYNTHTGVWRKYEDGNGWLEGGVMAMEEDAKGNLWISTQQGLIKKNSSGVFTSYSGPDGLFPLQEFNLYSSYKNPQTGDIFFGGASGFIGFQPDRLEENIYIPPVSISRLTALRNEERGKSYKETVYNLTNKSEIELTHLDRILTFEVSALNFYKRHKNKFKYRLIGFQEEWVDLGNENKFSLTNLDFGTYWLEVMGSNNDGLWNPNPKRFKITILAPWWLRPWAITLYIVIFLSILIGLLVYFQQQQKKRIEQNQKAFELENLRELDRLRSQFFTNISHEFRTPLTLIEGPTLEYLSLLNQNGSLTLGKLNGKRYLERVLDNCSKLLTLVNQLMKLSQLEAGTLTLHASKQELGPIIEQMFAQFESLSERKNIRFEVISPQKNLEVYVDIEKFETILRNLLGNAFKFTPSYGTVELRVLSSEHFLTIEVFNSHSFIPDHEVEKIFDRFYQSQSQQSLIPEGTGIGLALVKELVELHQGSVTVESEKNVGTTFSIYLRRGKDHLSQEELTIQHISPEIRPDYSPEPSYTAPVYDPLGGDNQRILVVEDNKSMRDFLHEILHPEYQILQSENGIDGWSKVIKEIPDLVISDVMMPKLEGTELCKRLKSDTRTRHIPIILLTAKEDKLARTEGLFAGANLYIAKPFDPNDLRLHIRNLLNQNQNAIRNTVRKNPVRMLVQKELLDPIQTEGKKVYSPSEKEFLQEAIKYIEQNLDNSSFRVEDLSNFLGISRGHLFRKIKEITGSSPNELILDIRISHATALLQSTSKPISEIAYLVGFSSPSHFSDRFKKHVGIRPRAYREKNG
ncbi:MAG: two-component regulator propeller domain-containing protein [Bacteroidota bacterium]